MENVGFVFAALVLAAWAFDTLRVSGQSVQPWFYRLAGRLGAKVSAREARGEHDGREMLLVAPGGNSLHVSLELADFPYSIELVREGTGRRARLVSTGDEASTGGALERLSLQGESLEREWRKYANAGCELSDGKATMKTTRWGFKKAWADISQTADILDRVRETSRDERLLEILEGRWDVALEVAIARAIAREEPAGQLAAWLRTRAALRDSDPVEHAIAAIGLGQPPTTLGALAEVANAEDGDVAGAAWLELAASDRELQLAVLESHELPLSPRMTAARLLGQTAQVDDVMRMRAQSKGPLAVVIRSSVLQVQSRAEGAEQGQLSVARVESGALSEVDG